MSRSWRPVTSGAPSEITRSTFAGVVGEGDVVVVDGEGEASRAFKRRGMVAGWVISARRQVMPGRGDIGWRSIATILTSLRGFDIDCFSLSSLSIVADAEFEVFEVDVKSGCAGCVSLSSCCRVASCLFSHAVRPKDSPFMRTRERTWDQLPGAAQRSTTRVTSAKRLNSEWRLVSSL